MKSYQVCKEWKKYWDTNEPAQEIVVNVFTFLSNEESRESVQMHIVCVRAFSAYIQKVRM